jgi:hypothetical protein
MAAPATAGEPDLLVMGGASWSNGQDALALDLAYRPAWSLLPWIEPWAELRPFAAALVTTRSQLWAGAGLTVEVTIGRLRLAVGSGPGLYAQGNGQDLGNDLVFRSQVELSWRFEGGWRVAVSAMHLSNAGLGDHNPGSDLIGASLQIPIGAH